ncbi:uncharacterized protein BX664DRAFT_341808 [Halteromyces radiatus]|uniref:uncharacterized protein n=1 Tax=Halteromyces radiatus TaxID=101107 RepID=UPI00221E3FEA|nr:uncharacterized protein BX664DRAFT_341808 [Halteromyces radiatus]KAI8079915.1 hypothetical protein BX664DRAFT_341808 [Halteromyces radiatus]
MPTQSTSEHPVLIMGAGLSGLTLAQTLKRQGIPYKVFDRDISRDGRANQGWSIMLRICLPYLLEAFDADFLKTLAAEASVNPLDPESAQFAYVDGITNKRLVFYDPKNYRSISSSDALEFNMYRVNRKRFRQWLMKGIDVTWNKRMTSYNITHDGVIVTFADGSIEKGSFLVGADGVQSAVCQHMLLNYDHQRGNSDDTFNKVTKINPTRLLATTRWITEEERDTIQYLSESHFAAFGQLGRDTDHPEGLRAFVSLNDIRHQTEKKYELLLVLSRYDDHHVIPRLKDPKERLEQFKAWAKDGLGGALQKIFLDTPDDSEVVDVAIRERAPQPDSLAQHQGRVTLIGDAAHTMTMFKGEGGNQAIIDAVKLGQLLGKVRDGDISLEQAIDQYHEEMIPRCTKAVDESNEACYLAHKAPDVAIANLKALIENAIQEYEQRQRSQ